MSGTAEQETGDVLIAPFSGIECVALRYQIEECRLSFPYILPWYVTIHEATRAVEFSVQSAAGTVPITEPIRTVVLTNKIVETTSADRAPSERIKQFEQKHEDIPESTVWQRPPAPLEPLFRMLSLGTRRYSEQRAARGEDVTVVGHVTDGGSGIDPVVVSDRSSMATVFRMAKTSIAGLLVGVCGLLLGYFLLFFG
ncbi:hypothetical protein [Haloplanus halobius]|uniref:hypothetical protein n=1 Tax=Haloplanus halobius TaxID=2934938 RepID=UPI00200BC94B|nr:hypothetical protein [Haloplanus sp. XH21]